LTGQGYGVVRPLPGDGVIAHAGGLLLVCEAGGAVEGLLAALRETAASGGDGLALARRAAQVLANAMVGEPAGCAVAGPSSGGVAVLVSGAAEASVSGGPEGSVQLSGRNALTWTDRLVPGPVTRIELRLPGAGQPAPHARLDGGVISGAGLICDFTDTEAPMAPVQMGPAPMAQPSMGQSSMSQSAMGQSSMGQSPMAAQAPAHPTPPEPLPAPSQEAMPQPAPAAPATPAPAAAAAAPAQEPMSAAGAPSPSGAMSGAAPQGGQMAGQGGPAKDEEPAGQGGGAPAEQAPAASGGVGPGQPFESVLLLPGQDEGQEGPKEPEPTEYMAEPESRPMVYGVDCKNDHFNDPRVPYCAVCGIALVQRTLVPYKGPRPPLGVLLLDDGMTLRLDTDYILGRDPERAAEVLNGEARPAKVTSPDGSVSRRHLRVKLDGWDVNLIDLGSVNGTQVQPPGDPNFYDIPPNEPVAILPGTTVRIGVSRTMRYESHRTA
jgi:Vesicle coat complex COPII, subunit SEC24/subunit SFB2/subunit SFB3